MSAVGVLDNDAGARRAMRRHLNHVTSPQPDVMTLQRKITGGGERAVAAAQHGNLHDASP
jgi:hypothetical protein